LILSGKIYYHFYPILISEKSRMCLAFTSNTSNEVEGFEGFEGWVEVMTPKERKRRAIEEENRKKTQAIEDEQRRVRKEREVARKKALEEISNALSIVRQDLEKENAIQLISPKTFENRLTRGGKRVNQRDLETRKRVSEIVEHMRRVSKAQNLKEKQDYLHKLMLPKIEKKASVLQWGSINFSNPISIEEIEMEESILQHLGI